MKSCISSQDEKYYTNMLKVMNAIKELMTNYNWLVSDIETNIECPLKKDYYLCTSDELMKFLNENEYIQHIWGCFSAIPKHYSYEDIVKYEIPYVNGNNAIYKEPTIQHPLADIEIDAIDSTFVQIIAKDDRVIEGFQKVFPLSEIK